VGAALAWPALGHASAHRPARARRARREADLDGAQSVYRMLSLLVGYRDPIIEVRCQLPHLDSLPREELGESLIAGGRGSVPVLLEPDRLGSVRVPVAAHAIEVLVVDRDTVVRIAQQCRARPEDTRLSRYASPVAGVVSSIWSTGDLAPLKLWG
jgi:hypothetical protein